MNKPVFTGPDAFRAAMAHILSTGNPCAEVAIPEPFRALGPNVKVRRIVVPEGGNVADAINGVLAEIEADFKAKREAEDNAQNGVNAVSVDTACDCPACAPTELVTDAQEDGEREDPLANLFRSKVKRLVEAFVAVAYPEVDVWTSESSVGNSNGYTFDLHVTGIDDFDTAETITITIPDNLMMTATNLELSSGLTGVLNYVGASINNLVD